MRKTLLRALLLLGSCLSFAPAGAEDTPRVQILTSSGPIMVELFADRSPVTVENFLGYVRDGFYDGTIFHRVIKGFMVQGGGFEEGMLKKTTGEPIVNESDNKLSNDRGTLAMARTNAPHTATAQFFINVVDNDFLDYGASGPGEWGYAVFGRVVEGMEVVDKVVQSDTTTVGPYRDVPQPAVTIESIRIVETEE